MAIKYADKKIEKPLRSSHQLSSLLMPLAQLYGANECCPRPSPDTEQVVATDDNVRSDPALATVWRSRPDLFTYSADDSGFGLRETEVKLYLHYRGEAAESIAFLLLDGVTQDALKQVMACTCWARKSRDTTSLGDLPWLLRCRLARK
ncbi:unnamed protein product [Phytophthora fragariaefolia]|uniref:Unnamed protein product n=1 Tax=Phytophthora fragariaefolia TaxID=1490495 RepID=A0A9W6X953_9STRA|nr:unnamed protein product [Phytophthora fragariaefolia]